VPLLQKLKTKMKTKNKVKIFEEENEEIK